MRSFGSFERVMLGSRFAVPTQCLQIIGYPPDNAGRSVGSLLVHSFNAQKHQSPEILARGWGWVMRLFSHREAMTDPCNYL